ncbi:MAG: hypothetical protein ACJ75H_03620 [Thermoanaerobaculia bacterium]
MWTRRLFLALALLYAVPFWTVHYLPTVDGPCHTYNSWILRQYHNTDRFPLFQQYYEINALPYPNWIGHGFMALLMFVAPPLVAEKLLATTYALTFLLGMWYLAGAVDPDRRWLAFLAFPFVYNFMFQFGFYNFSMSLALFPWILGAWWRHRERPGPGFAVGINLLLWLCWLSHPVSFALALLGIAVLWLATLRPAGWRRHFVHIPILAPQGFLPLWYFAAVGSERVGDFWGFRRLWRYFTHLGALAPLDRAQTGLAQGLAWAFLLLLLLTLWRRTAERRGPSPAEGDAFLLLAGVATLIYFLGPEGMSGGTMLKNRLSLYPYLLLIPWLSPRLGAWGRRAAVGVLSLAALCGLFLVLRAYRAQTAVMEQYLAGLASVRPDSRVLPLFFARDGRGAQMDMLGHALSYAALEKGLVDWDNYEATVSFFPVGFRESAPPPDTARLETAPRSLRLKEWKRLADYVYVWGLPPGDPFAARLQKASFRPVAEAGAGVLWERRRRDG